MLFRSQEMAANAKERRMQAKLQVIQVFIAIALAIVIACTIAGGALWVITADDSPLNAGGKTSRK